MLYVYPEGNKSVTSTPVLSCGPPLVTITVKVTKEPTVGVVLLTVFEIDKSDTAVTGVVEISA